MLDILINPVKKKLRAELNRVDKLALIEYKTTGNIPESIYIDHMSNVKQIAKQGFVIGLKSGARFYLGLMVADKLIKKNEVKDFYNGLQLEIERYADEQSVETANHMAQTTKKTLIDSLDKHRLQQEANGKERNAYDIFAIIALATAEAKERSIWRSFIGGLAIIHGAASKGGNDSAKKVAKDKGYRMVKGWVTMRDDKVRDTHVVMDMVTVGIDEKFHVPNGGGFDLMEYPGDRSASIANWINCRCTLTYKKQNTK
jgi:hypothetical protein